MHIALPGKIRYKSSSISARSNEEYTKINSRFSLKFFLKYRFLNKPIIIRA
jgi:hypothetical protein